MSTNQILYNHILSITADILNIYTPRYDRLIAYLPVKNMTPDMTHT
jgi:hypothetical protein